MLPGRPPLAELLAMCYSAEVWEDFRLYERMGGTLDIHAFAQMMEARRATGDLFKVVPKAMREPFEHPRNEGEKDVKEKMLEAYRAATLAIEEEIATQTERLVKADAVLASAKPTKKAENDKRVATNKVAAAREKLEEMQAHAQSDGFGRMWPGQFAPVLIRDHSTGARMIVPARYRCRLPGWTKAMELEKPGTYNARKDKLHTVWKKLFGYNHGVIVARRFYESVSLHRLQQRAGAGRARHPSRDPVRARAEAGDVPGVPVALRGSDRHGRGVLFLRRDHARSAS